MVAIGWAVARGGGGGDGAWMLAAVFSPLIDDPDADQRWWSPESNPKPA